MDRLPYQQAFDRIRAEYLEMPGLRLTVEQAERLCGVPRGVCHAVLADLTRAGLLHRRPDNSYARRTNETVSPPLRSTRYVEPEASAAATQADPSTRVAGAEVPLDPA